MPTFNWVFQNQPIASGILRNLLVDENGQKRGIQVVVRLYIYIYIFIFRQYFVNLGRIFTQKVHLFILYSPVKNDSDSKSSCFLVSCYLRCKYDFHDYILLNLMSVGVLVMLLSKIDSQRYLISYRRCHLCKKISIFLI